MGSIWEGFGTLWAALWSLLGAFWWFFGRSKSYLVKALVQDGLQEPFESILGGVVERFGKGFGKVWEGNSEDFDVFVQVVGRFWGHLEKCGRAAAELVNWTPALIREASQ